MDRRTRRVNRASKRVTARSRRLKLALISMKRSLSIDSNLEICLR